MLDSSDVIAFVPTTGIDASRRFFGETLGLPLLEEDPFACVFDAHGTMLRVTPVPELPPRPYTVLGWSVDDIVETVQRLADRGVVFERFEGMGQDDLGIWTTPDGARVAWFRDPSGNTLSLTQFPTDPCRAERQQLSACGRSGAPRR